MPNTILIVDDQVELTQILGDYFRTKKGYDVFIATDGRAALDIIRRQMPKLVLLDMKLPSVNGLEILKILHKEYPDTKVIVMTAYDLEFKKEIDLVGYDAFFVKPILFEELKDRVEALLTKDTAGQPPKAKIFPASSQKEEVLLPEDRSNLLPKANIVIIEIRGNIAMLLKDYLEKNRENGLYRVVYFKSGSLFLNEIIKFNPDIVLYDILEIGTFSEFAQQLMDLPHPPTEVILFGDPKFKWEEVDLLVKEGMRYISTSLDSTKYHDLELPTRDTVERLANTIKEVCFKHRLLTPKGEAHA